jgi:thiosulfate reductase cytochrome b subunit
MFLILIVSGLALQYSSQDYQIIRFDYAVSIHNISGLILAFGFILYLVANALSGNYKYYKCNQKGCFIRLGRQFQYYLFGIFKKEQAPFPITKERKFNPLQKMSYLFAMYLLMPLLIITGIALMYPEIIIPDVFGFSGIHLTDLLHIICGFVLSIFMVVHIYFCTIGKSPIDNFKSMFTGWHSSH